MHKYFILFPAMMGLLLLSGCNPPVALTAIEGGTMYLTKPDELPPADTVDQMAQHESWCYRTLGTIDCYSEPQDVPADRLVMVDPQNRYPLTNRAYKVAVAQSQPSTVPENPVASTPAVEAPAVAAPVQPAQMTPIPEKPKTTVQKTPTHKKHKKHKKTTKKLPKPCSCKDDPPPK